MGAIRTRLARQAELFSTLRYRDFRLFWGGLVAQVTGQQMTMVTLGWLAFHLTGSPLTLGYINLVQAAPMITLNLLGGALADRMDQRHLITFSQSATAIILSTIALLTFTELIEVWQLIAAAFLLGLARAFDEPSRQALFPHLLPDRSLIAAAVPLMSMAWQVNRIVAPSIAGFVIAAAGAEASFALAAAGAATMVAVLRLLRLERITRQRSGNVLTNIVEGTRHAWKHMAFRVIIGTSFINSIFAMGYMLMMPVFAEAVHGVGEVGLGIMYSATGIGSIVSLFAVTPVMRAFPPGRVVAVGILGFLAAIIAFALAPWYLLALPLLTTVGFFQHLYLSSGQIVLQSLVEDSLRGRIMGLFGMLWSFVPLGGALLNATANFVGAPAALAGGASVVLAFVVLVVIPNRGLRNVALPTSERTR